MPEKQPNSSPPQIDDKQPREGFGPPEITSLASLTDGRVRGDFATRYSTSAWVQICLELLYLLLILVVGISCLAWMARAVVLGLSSGPFAELFGETPRNTPLLVWAAAGLAGACGGAASAVKWLYHSVAKQQWHRDRVVWRIVVPPLSAILSVFAGLMIVSELIPIFNRALFTSPVTGAAFGFFVGMFSDNLLASLQKLAYKIFGTVDKAGGGVD
jgi:hypothetical protein